MKKINFILVFLLTVLGLNGQTLAVVSPQTQRLTVAEWVRLDSLLRLEEFPTHLTFTTDSTANFYRSDNPVIEALFRKWKFSHKDELTCTYADAEEGITVWQSWDNSLSVTLSDWNTKLVEVTVNGFNKKGEPKYVWYFCKE